VAKGTLAFARRDMPGKTGKSIVDRTQVSSRVSDILLAIHESLYDRALAFRQSNIYDPQNYDEMREVLQKGWAYSWWCGNPECETRMKEDTKATARGIPLDQPDGEGGCIYCGSKAKEKAYFARAY
jgi:prolyl-tRNA synthetase